jgi:Holliday junction resolvasome RuvABC endonuclease subunit
VRVLGIDPSLTHTGFAWVELDLESMEFVVTGLQLVKTKGAENVRKSADDMRRAGELGDALRVARQSAALVFAEVPSGAQNARSAFANGVVLGTLATAAAPLIQVSPAEVKKAAVGKLNASKAEMIAWATTQHPEAPWLTRRVKGQSRLLLDNEHLADAVAVVQAGLASDQFKQVLSLMRTSGSQ